MKWYNNLNISAKSGRIDQNKERQVSSPIVRIALSDREFGKY